MVWVPNPGNTTSTTTTTITTTKNSNHDNDNTQRQYEQALITLPKKTNIAPENKPSQKETSHSLPSIHFQVLC